MFHGSHADAFGVSVLGADQAELARLLRRHLATPWGSAVRGRRPGRRRSHVRAVAGRRGRHFECLRWRCYDGGDHAIVLGRLVSFERDPAEDPLLFHGGRFRVLAPGPVHAVGERRSTSHARDIG